MPVLLPCKEQAGRLQLAWWRASGPQPSAEACSLEPRQLSAGGLCLALGISRGFGCSRSSPVADPGCRARTSLACCTGWASTG